MKCSILWRLTRNKTKVVNKLSRVHSTDSKSALIFSTFADSKSALIFSTFAHPFSFWVFLYFLEISFSYKPGPVDHSFNCPKLCHITSSSNISNTRVFHQDIQTPRGKLKIQRAAEYFWRNSRCLDSRWNTVSSVWYIFSIETKTKE